MTAAGNGPGATGQARDAAQQAASDARDKAQELGGQAKDKAQDAGAQARGRLHDEVDRRSTEAGDQAGSAAEALRQASQHLRDQGNEPVAKGIERAADRIERAGGWLHDSDGDSILRDVEDFARRNPLAVAAAGLAVGFAASRVLKASSRRRFEGDGLGSREPIAELPPATGPGAGGPAAGGEPGIAGAGWQPVGEGEGARGG